MYIYVYIYICMCMYIEIYVYTNIPQVFSDTGRCQVSALNLEMIFLSWEKHAPFEIRKNVSEGTHKCFASLSLPSKNCHPVSPV